jgi:alpha-D-ribose 1-methylphosphonate 5-triphosphate synthase subunit PhnL
MVRRGVAGVGESELNRGLARNYERRSTKIKIVHDKRTHAITTSTAGTTLRRLVMKRRELRSLAAFSE